MLHKIIIGGLLCIFMISSLNAKDYYNKTTDAKKIAWMDKGKNLLKSKLKDGKSARFKNVYFNVGSIGVPATCGKVNAKNSFGAYMGYIKFISAGRLEFTFTENDVSDFYKLWNQMCR